MSINLPKSIAYYAGEDLIKPHPDNYFVVHVYDLSGNLLGHFTPLNMECNVKFYNRINPMFDGKLQNPSLHFPKELDEEAFRVDELLYEKALTERYDEFKDTLLKRVEERVGYRNDKLLFYIFLTLKDKGLDFVVNYYFDIARLLKD